jgi:hypothetical protein
MEGIYEVAVETGLGAMVYISKFHKDWSIRHSKVDGE